MIKRTLGSTTIVGTMNPDHVTENLKTMEKGPLSDKVYQEAKRRLDAAGQRPEWWRAG